MSINSDHRLYQLNLDGFKSAQLLLETRNMSLKNYLKKIIPKSLQRTNTHFDYVLSAIAGYLDQRGVSIDIIENTCNHLKAFPVIQQADHSNLLFDMETFLNNYLFSIGSKESGANQILISQYSTVSCVCSLKPLIGPAYLRSRNNLYKIFPYSKQKFKKSNFCCLTDPIETSFELLEGTALKNDQIINNLSNRTFASGTEAFWVCNNEIWDSLNSKYIIPRVAIDESVTSELLAMHITDKNSPIRKLLFDIDVRDTFLNIKRSFVHSSKNRVMNRPIPDFFWYRHNSMLYPVEIRGNDNHATFYIAEKNIPLSVAYTSDNLSSALRNGTLYGDIILSYFVRCLLPEITTIGGLSQQEYVEHHRNIFLDTHSCCPFLTKEEAQSLMRDDLSQLGGYPLLELNPKVTKVLSWMDSKTDLDTFIDNILPLPVWKTIGDFTCSDYLMNDLKKIRLKNKFV